MHCAPLGALMHASASKHQYTFNSHLNYLNLKLSGLWIVKKYQDEGHDMIIRYYLCPLAGKSWLEHCMVFISCMSKRRYFHMIRESEKTSIFTPPPLNWDMGRAVIIFYKRLTAMLNEKRDSHTANDGVNMFPLELCPPKTLSCVYQEFVLLQSSLEMQLCVSLLISSQNVQAWMVQLL